MIRRPATRPVLHADPAVRRRGVRVRHAGGRWWHCRSPALRIRDSDPGVIGPGRQDGGRLRVARPGGYMATGCRRPSRARCSRIRGAGPVPSQGYGCGGRRRASCRMPVNYVIWPRPFCTRYINRPPPKLPEHGRQGGRASGSGE